MFEDFTAKAEKEDTFTLTVDNETSYEMSSDNGVLVLVVNFAISDNLIVRDITFPHGNIHEHTWTSLVHRTQIDDSIQVYLISCLLDEMVVILTSA
jgi:hypothetical protein